MGDGQNCSKTVNARKNEIKMQQTEYLIEMERIVKIFPGGLYALNEVDFRVRPGTIHALIGKMVAVNQL